MRTAIHKKNIRCWLPFKKAWCYSFIAFIFSGAASQTTNISGIVNTYHRVIEVVPSKACIRVADPTGLNVNTLVMLVQMKGATINTTASSSAFGDVSSLNGAGNYEIGTICYIIGDSVFLFHNLLNSYDVSAKVQLVQFAEYYSANVTDTVKAMSWDSTAGLGGVIAIFADQDITLNKPIWADSSGYSGGLWYNNSGTCGFAQPVGTNFAYDITATNNLNGAYKGESVANIASSINSAKGAPANGGGGGNNHNNSGGGGANLSAGGNGGGNSSGTPFGCATTGNYGRGGKALSSAGGTKIFMGGGAGAGHANNGGVSFNYGGNGGGIILIWANNLIGNSQLISAGGGSGGDSQADGAGGGGAGGTIIMHVTNYTGGVTIAANGGSGGDSYNDNSIIRCFGGGGGGSGGAIYFTGSAPAVTINTNGGGGGQEFNRNAGCNAAVAGAGGSVGAISSSYTLRRSTDPAGYCQLLLPSKLLYFNAELTRRQVVCNWQIDYPELVKEFAVEKRMNNGEWVIIKSVPAVEFRNKYFVTDQELFAGQVYYRLKITEKDGTVYYSETRMISVKDHTGSIFIYPNPARGKALLKGNFETGGHLIITESSGKTVWKLTITENIQLVTLPVLPAGIYIVSYKNEHKKWMIQ